jgi:hypothetical protein
MDTNCGCVKRILASIDRELEEIEKVTSPELTTNAAVALHIDKLERHFLPKVQEAVAKDRPSLKFTGGELDVLMVTLLWGRIFALFLRARYAHKGGGHDQPNQPPDLTQRPGGDPRHN